MKCVRFHYAETDPNYGLYRRRILNSGDFREGRFFVTSALGDQTHASIVNAARGRLGVGGVVIAFADWRYRAVLMNWLVALDLLGITNYLVISLDPTLHDFLVARGLPSVPAQWDGSLPSLWQYRVQVFSALCSSGTDFIHSDVDAVWLRDPLATHFLPLEQDLVITQGTVWPPDVHQRFGFVLCCGLFRLRATDRSRALLRDLAADVLRSGDDQLSLNRLIAMRAPQWQADPQETYHVGWQNTRFLCSRRPMSARCADGLEVGVLPHHLFQRVDATLSEAPFVRHLLTPKDPERKLSEFQRQGCLLLRSDWEVVSFDAQSLARLHDASVAARTVDKNFARVSADGC